MCQCLEYLTTIIIPVIAIIEPINVYLLTVIPNTINDKNIVNIALKFIIRWEYPGLGETLTDFIKNCLPTNNRIDIKVI